MARMATEREHREFQEMLGAYALDALTDEERLALETHLSNCDECTAELADLRLAVQALPLSVEEQAPSPSLRERLRAAAEAEVSASQKLDGTGEPAFTHNVTPLATSSPSAITVLPAWRRALPWAAAAVFLLFGLAMLGWNLSLHQSSNQQVVALQPAAGVSGAGGELIYLKDQQVMIVKPQGLPSLAPGKVYEVWLIQGNTPIAAGVLDRSSGQVAVAANMSQYQALAITIENGPLGSSTPTGQKVIVTPF